MRPSGPTPQACRVASALERPAGRGPFGRARPQCLEKRLRIQVLAGFHQAERQRGQRRRSMADETARRTDAAARRECRRCRPPGRGRRCRGRSVRFAARSRKTASGCLRKRRVKPAARRAARRRSDAGAGCPAADAPRSPPAGRPRMSSASSPTTSPLLVGETATPAQSPAATPGPTVTRTAFSLNCSALTPAA